MGKERVQLPSLAALAHNLNGARNQLSRLRQRHQRRLPVQPVVVGPPPNENLSLQYNS